MLSTPQYGSARSTSSGLGTDVSLFRKADIRTFQHTRPLKVFKRSMKTLHTKLHGLRILLFSFPRLPS